MDVHETAPLTAALIDAMDEIDAVDGTLGNGTAPPTFKLLEIEEMADDVNERSSTEVLHRGLRDDDDEATAADRDEDAITADNE